MIEDTILLYSRFNGQLVFFNIDKKT